MRHRGGSSARSEEGVVLIEFAFVFALFVFILYALIAFGMALSLKHSVTHSAGEGARAAVGVVDDPLTAEDEREKAAVDEVKTSLDWIGPEKLAVTVIDATAAPCGTNECMTVKITYPYKDKPVVPEAPGLGVMTPDTMSSTAVVKISN
jgi:hypothetical protein